MLLHIAFAIPNANALRAFLSGESNVKYLAFSTLNTKKAPLGISNSKSLARVNNTISILRQYYSQIVKILSFFIILSLLFDFNFSLFLVSFLYQGISSSFSKFLYCLENEQWHLTFTYPFFQIHFPTDSLSHLNIISSFILYSFFIIIYSFYIHFQQLYFSMKSVIFTTFFTILS